MYYIFVILLNIRKNLFNGIAFKVAKICTGITDKIIDKRIFFINKDFFLHTAEFGKEVATLLFTGA